MSKVAVFYCGRRLSAETLYFIYDKRVIPQSFSDFLLDLLFLIVFNGFQLSSVCSGWFLIEQSRIFNTFTFHLFTCSLEFKNSPKKNFMEILFMICLKLFKAASYYCPWTILIPAWINDLRKNRNFSMNNVNSQL